MRFVEPHNGDIVTSPFNVEMAAQGLTVEPAGEIHAGAGHFHILIDTDFIAPGELLPFDESHLHFGKGQTTATLDLKPGVHVLRLQFANGAHIALAGDEYRATITVTVAATPTTAIASPTVTATMPIASMPITASSTVTPTSVMSDAIASPSVRFVEPHNGDIVTSPFNVEMAAQGLTVEPAGEIHAGAGHFHILIDTDFIAPGELLPFDESHLHFGKGQTTATLDLKPGVHVLRLQFANGAHIALAGDEYRATITVTVAAK